MKSKRRIKILTNFVTIGHVNKPIGHVNGAIQFLSLESNNEKTKCADKYKQTSIEYDIKGEENA